ncbi:MAG: GSCFA family protein, partial [Caulobacteraceae bacterium]
GLDSPDEVQAHRRHHLRQVKSAFRQADVFIFTLGLTETWADRTSGQVFPTAPGVLAGRYDPDQHVFLNQGFGSVVSDFLAFRAQLKRRNPDVRFVLTVSPVPLTATAGDEHVLAATLYSKSVLRAAAGELAQAHDDIDYFPSYEIVASPFNRTSRYQANLRSVSADGVEAVMQVFFAHHGDEARPRNRPAPKAAPAPAAQEAPDVVCEEALLEAFAR